MIDNLYSGFKVDADYFVSWFAEKCVQAKLKACVTYYSILSEEYSYEDPVFFRLVNF